MKRHAQTLRREGKITFSASESTANPKTGFLRHPCNQSRHFLWYDWFTVPFPGDLLLSLPLSQRKISCSSQEDWEWLVWKN